MIRSVPVSMADLSMCASRTGGTATPAILSTALVSFHNATDPCGSTSRTAAGCPSFLVVTARPSTSVTFPTPHLLQNDHEGLHIGFYRCCDVNVYALMKLYTAISMALRTLFIAKRKAQFV